MEVKITKLDQNSTVSSKKNRTKTTSNVEDNNRERVNLQPLYDESTLQSERSNRGGKREKNVVSNEELERKLKEEEELKKAQQQLLEEEISEEEESNDSDNEEEEEEEEGLEEEDIEEIDITEDPLYQVLSAVLEDEEGNNIVECINELKQAVLINTQYIKRIAHAIEKLADRK
jgi:2-succinyl-5-enolpyruvyl-6-hydroxy-3-cyclohexene-1-carboxylate synthase